MIPDERALRSMIATFRKWRTRPPTFASLLLSQRYLMAFAIYGVCSAAAICYFVVAGASPEPCYLVGGMFVGAMTRYTAMMRQIAQNWRIQDPFMDWDKIDATARELGI